MVKPTFTPRQLEAQQLYARKFKPIVLPVLLFLSIGWAAFLCYSYYAKTRLGYSSGDLLHSVMLAALLVAIIGAVGLFWAHKRAMNAVRRAGLLDESREIIRRTAATFAGENLTFEFPDSRWSQLGFVLMLVGVAALTGWFAVCFATQIAERILGALAFAFFFGTTLLTVASMNKPILRLDELGVFAYHHNFWPRLVRWREIESAHFHRWSNFHDGADIHTITLKNAAGKTLLTLGAATFLDAPPELRERFVAELRRRLTGADASGRIASL